ncbi:MAG TPA: glycosyltransferase [Candidatus Syntrophosphaera sp.]|nr:glycosyltransferase [Candidatus Syntrophosphaera sp.]HQG94476.1 glycosyltransferase [Candidatus Syntrophosphaera sp.]HQK29694.1 glycosyltransferase [Candidatus Syntrophosphaera sp.]HQO67709.1 glycosyltransferase [Candidatus Syntrophosphaera sp.]HRQ68053.1 glycosyltransferase [Candidatus Syntrophosphaera sp.]
MTKLLHLQLLPLLSGVQNFSLHLLDGLPRDEFEIYVASAPGGDLVDAVRQRGYKHIPLRFLRHPISPLDATALAELLLMLGRHRFDIVHTNASKPGLLGRLAARLCHVPLILHTEHGTAFQEDQPAFQQYFFRQLEKVGNSLGHKVVFVNHSDRENCLSLGLLPEEKALTINNALPPVQAEKLAQVAADRKFDPDKQDFVIGSTFRFTTQKNVVNITGAACQACAREPGLRFILLGDGEYLQLCRQIVSSHGLNSRVLLPGWEADIGKWLPLFDAFLLYSRWEAQPFSIIEAMHAGLPILGSDIPSIRELVGPDCGWLVPLDDQTALINCLVEVSRDRADAFQKGRTAAQTISGICSYEKMVAGYLKLYREGAGVRK